jgi:hypothetical protein
MHPLQGLESPPVTQTIGEEADQVLNERDPVPESESRGCSMRTMREKDWLLFPSGENRISKQERESLEITGRGLEVEEPS